MPSASPASREGVALRIFSTVPAWAIVHAAGDDDAAPLIRSGEVAVVEADGCSGWRPEDDGLFLIEYVATTHGRYGRERRTRRIVQTRRSNRGHGWYAVPYRNARNREEAQRELARGRITCADGPYQDADALAERLIGRVVGIYRPAALGELEKRH